MTNQQSEVLSLALLRNLAKKWWIILIFALIGGLISFNSRKDFKPRQRMQVTMLSSINAELFNYLAEQSKDVQIVITSLGSAIIKVAAEADNDVENKVNQWIKDSNAKLYEMVGKELDLAREKKEVAAKRKQLACENLQNDSRENKVKCLMSEIEFIEAKQELNKQEYVIKVIDIKPYFLPTASLPIRDILFGMIVGAFIGTMLVGLYIQIKMVKR